MKQDKYLLFCIKEIKKSYGKHGIRISGQVYALQFYKKLGFIPKGDEYLEDGIPHMNLYISAMK